MMSNTAGHLHDALDDLEHSTAASKKSVDDILQHAWGLQEEISQARLGAEIEIAEYNDLVIRLAGIIKEITKE